MPNYLKFNYLESFLRRNLDQNIPKMHCCFKTSRYKDRRNCGDSAPTLRWLPVGESLPPNSCVATPTYCYNFYAARFQRYYDMFKNKKKL